MHKYIFLLKLISPKINKSLLNYINIFFIDIDLKHF